MVSSTKDNLARQGGKDHGALSNCEHFRGVRLRGKSIKKIAKNGEHIRLVQSHSSSELLVQVAALVQVGNG